MSDDIENEPTTGSAKNRPTVEQDIVTRLRATEQAIWDGDDAEERRAFIKMVADEIDRWRNLAIHAWCHMGVDATCSSDDCEECQAIKKAWENK